MAICLSGGFCNVDILSRSVDVQLGSGDVLIYYYMFLMKD